MTGTQVMICVLTFIMCYFGSSSYSNYLKNKKNLQENNNEADKYQATITALSKANELTAEICKRSVEAKKDIIKPLAVNKQVQIGNTSFFKLRYCFFTVFFDIIGNNYAADIFAAFV